MPFSWTVALFSLVRFFSVFLFYLCICDRVGVFTNLYVFNDSVIHLTLNCIGYLIWELIDLNRLICIMLFSFGLNEISNLFILFFCRRHSDLFHYEKSASHQSCRVDSVDMTLNENKRKNQNVMLNVICNAFDCTLFKIIPKPIQSIPFHSIPFDVENSANFLATHAF